MRRLLLLAFFLLPLAASAQIPTASGVATTSDANGYHYYTFSFPGYAKFQLGDGIGSINPSSCNGNAGPRQLTQCQSLTSYWDLKNDPTAQWDFGGDSETISYVWGVTNADTTVRIAELKEGPMPVTVTESNNVRVVFTQTNKVYSFGESDHLQDCCITMTKTYVFYRHGGAGVGTGASKIYTKTTLNYDGTDGKGPLTLPNNALLNVKASWWKVNGETIGSANACSQLVGYSLSPWNIIYPLPDTTNSSKDYILLAPVNANSVATGAFIPANTCVSPGGSFQGPEGTGGQPSPGTIYNCNGATNSGCVSQSVNAAVVKANFLWIEQETAFNFPNLQLSNSYFMGGIRIQGNLGPITGDKTLNTNVPVSWITSAFFGDNGITNDTAAKLFVTEYKTPPTMTPTNATGGTFDVQQGYWTVARTADTVSISANGVLHSPAWLISNWSATSSGMTVGGATKTINTDFVAVKTDSTHLLIQYLGDVASSTTVAFTTSGVPIVITPVAPYVNQGATLQFTADAAGTWSCAGTDNSGSASACHGSINASTGLYTAPASVTAQQTLGGYQLLPNNHIFNTKIDTLSVHASNTTWMNLVNVGGQPYAVDTFTGMPINYITPSTSDSVNMHFYYTTGNNGVFEVPKFPAAKIEAGWFGALANDSPDHHLLSIDTTSGTLSDFYQYYATCHTTAASVTSNVAKLTCSNNPVAAGFLIGGPTPMRTANFTGGDTFFNTTGNTIMGLNTTSISFPLVHANASATSNGDAGLGLFGCAECNSQSGIKYNYYDYALPPIATDAAGMTIQPLLVRLQEAERAVATTGTINHAMRVTLGAGYMCSCNIWPATTFATDGATVPFGARARLKSSFNISGYSATAQVFLKQLQQYGLIVADGGINWDTSGETNVWPKTYVDAMAEVAGAGLSFTITNTALTSNVLTVTAVNTLAAGNLVSLTGTTNGGGVLNFRAFIVASASGSQFTANFTHADIASAADTGTVLSALTNFMEFVDESPLMISSSSGLTTRNREIVTFTRTSDSTTASADVALQGVAVNFPQDYLYIMAGTPAQQLPVLVNIGTVTWMMSPSVGTLTSGGLYTAPATLSSATTTTITATSTTDATVAAQLNVTVFPHAAIRVIPSRTTDYTDTLGNVWTGFTGTDQPGTLASSPCGGLGAMTDQALWKCQIGYSSSVHADTRMNFTVPNGSYQVTYHYGTQTASGVLRNKVSVQGSVFLNNDFAGLAGGINQAYTNVVSNVTVTDNKLSYIIWPMPGGSDRGMPVSSLSIVPGSSPAGSTLPPNVKVTSGVSIK